MGGAVWPGTVWTADDCGDVVCRTRDRSRGAAWFCILECCRDWQLSRIDRVLTRGEFRRCDHDDNYVVARVFSSARTAGDAKQAITSGRFLRLRRLIAAGEGTRGHRDSVWRRWFVLHLKTRVAVAIGGAECDLGRAVGPRSISDLVWTSYRTTW